jgi:hypothetical protein
LGANDQRVLLVPHPSNVFATSPPSFGSGSDLSTVASLEEIVAARVSELCDHLCTMIDEQFASLRMELASIRETIASQGPQSSFNNPELFHNSIDKPTESSAVGMMGEFASLRMELASIRETIATQEPQTPFDIAELFHKSSDKPTESSAVGMIGEIAERVTVSDAVESNVDDGEDVVLTKGPQSSFDNAELFHKSTDKPTESSAVGAIGEFAKRVTVSDDVESIVEDGEDVVLGMPYAAKSYMKRNDLSFEESCGGRVLRDIRAGNSLDIALKVMELNVQDAGKVLNSELVHKFVSCQLEAIEPLTKLRDSRMSLLKEPGKNAKQIRKDPQIMELTRLIDELYLYNDEKGFAIVNGNATAHKRGVCENTP